MNILGFNWFDLANSVVPKLEWTSKMITAYRLGIFVWVLIAIVSLLVLFYVIKIVSVMLIIFAKKLRKQKKEKIKNDKTN